MANQIVTWVGNSEDGDNTAIIRLGTEANGTPILLFAGKSKELTEAQIAMIHPRHILVTGDQSASVIVRDPAYFRAALRGKSVTPIGR